MAQGLLDALSSMRYAISEQNYKYLIFQERLGHDFLLNNRIIPNFKIRNQIPFFNHYFASLLAYFNIS